jgi:outer membrane protein TolC
LYESKILPAAQENVAAARAGYEAGTVDFLRLVEAQRQIIELREKHQMAITEFHRRTAELERAVGDDLQSREFAPSEPATEPPPLPNGDQ